MVAAAVIGSAVVGAAGSAVAGSEAAGATKAASNAAIQEQQAALAQQAQLSAPYRALGESAIPQLQGLLGITPAGTPANTATQQAAQTAALRNTPGYQFQQEQGTLNTLNSASAQGMNLSGNTLEALSKFNQGLADTTYQQAIGNLENVVNTGQAAAAGQASNVGNAAGNISNALINQGNTLAGIDANTAAGITKSIGNAANQYTAYNTLQGLNNPTSASTASTPAYDYGPPSTGVTTNFEDTAPGTTTYFGGP